MSVAPAGLLVHLQIFTDDASRVPSLVGAAVAMLLAVQIWIFGLLADLLSANRRLVSDTRVMIRRREIDEAAGRSRRDR